MDYYRVSWMDLVLSTSTQLPIPIYADGELKFDCEFDFV